MTASEDKKDLGITLPGEWALQKAFGPALTEIGEDLKRLYVKGRDMVLNAGYRKIQDINDGKQANLRVMRDVLWNGAFSDNEVCAEYFGGMLASSRSDDGEDDSAIQYVDVIKSLSAKQLELHYVIYNCLNKLFLKGEKRINVALSTELYQCKVWCSEIELETKHKLQIDTDLSVLHRVGLLSAYKIDSENLGDEPFPYVWAVPTTFGVLLYMAAHNRLDEWHDFDRVDFADFASVGLPKFFAPSLYALKEQTRLKDGSEAKMQETS